MRGQDETAAADTAAEAAAEAAADADPAATLSEAAAGATPFGGGRAAAAAAASRPIGDDLLLPEGILDGPQPQYDPLWKVEARIREELANERATQAMQNALKALQQQLSGYFGAVAKWQVQNPNDPPPAKPDLAALATQYGVSLQQTALVSAIESRLSTDLGQSAVGGSEPFDSFAFGRFPLNSPQLSQDSDGNQYLFWKTEETADRIPEFDEVRAEVVLAYKARQARELARQRAEELASTARQQPGKSLEEVFVGQRGLKVVRPRPFQWLVQEGADQFSPNTPPRLGEVDEVPQAGPQFMQTVFEMELDQVGVALNNPQDRVYLIRLVQLDPPVRVLRSTFMADNFRRYALAGLDDDVRLGRRWREQLESDSELTWVRPPRTQTDN